MLASAAHETNRSTVTSTVLLRILFFSALLVFVTIHHTNSPPPPSVPSFRCAVTRYELTSLRYRLSYRAMRAHCIALHCIASFFPLRVPSPPGSKCQRAICNQTSKFRTVLVPYLSKSCCWMERGRRRPGATKARLWLVGLCRRARPKRVYVTFVPFKFHPETPVHGRSATYRIIQTTTTTNLYVYLSVSVARGSPLSPLSVPSFVLQTGGKFN